eukprot:COSAG01_NODE_53780_length_336_cov_2.016878_1_plen_72_part_01
MQPCTMWGTAWPCIIIRTGPAASHTGAETTILILAPTSTRHAPFAREVPGGVPLAMFGRDSLPVRETLASSH